MKSYLFPIYACHFLLHNTKKICTFSFYGDVNVIVNTFAGLKEMLRLANTTAFRSVGASPSDPYKEYYPPCNSLPYPSDEYLTCRLRHYVYTIYHPTSTCRMGKDGDDTAVVDLQLRYTFYVNNILLCITQTDEIAGIACINPLWGVLVFASFTCVLKFIFIILDHKIKKMIAMIYIYIFNT